MYAALVHSGLDANGVTVGKELLDFLMHSAFHMQRVVSTVIGFRVMQDVIPEKWTADEAEACQSSWCQLNFLI